MPTPEDGRGQGTGDPTHLQLEINMNEYSKNTLRVTGSVLAVFAGLMLLVWLAVLPVGCAVFRDATPTGRLDAATITYTSLLNAAADLRQQGQLSDDDYRAVQSVRMPIAAALDRAKARIDAGDEPGARTDLDRAAGFLDELARVLASARDDAGP